MPISHEKLRIEILLILILNTWSNLFIACNFKQLKRYNCSNSRVTRKQNYILIMMNITNTERTLLFLNFFQPEDDLNFNGFKT